MKKTAFLLSVIFILCALFVKPDIFPQMISSAETAQETKAHAAWKSAAEESGAELCSYEENVYYAQSSEENIVPVGNSFAYVNNEVIVYFRDGTGAKEKQTLAESIGAQIVGCADVINKYQLRLSEKKSWTELKSLCSSLRRNKNVAFASCNLAMHLEEDAVPDDPWMEDDKYSAIYNWDETFLYGGNWWLKATQTISAWDYASYFHPIRVGILDSGFYVDHEDLQGKINFPSNYYRRSNRPSAHGTHVSGIVSANANNKIGITGICNQAELMCVDWEPEKDDHQYWSTNERIFTGVIALIKSGAKVINLSLGSSSGYEEKKQLGWNINMNLEGALFSFMMASLLNRGYDFLVVQSAGNGNKANDPCDSFYNGSFCSITKKNAFTGLTRISKQKVLDHILIVGSCTMSHDETEFYQSSFSNYGSGVSIFAPGSYVFSTDIPENGGYSYKSGTSMAAPVVTAIAALTWSVNPDLTGDQVKAILCDPENTTYTCVNYYNDTMDIPSYPMVNAKLAVEAAIRTLPHLEEATDDAFETEPITIPRSVDGQAQANQEVPHLGKSDRRTIERFRGEIGE